MDFRIEEKEAFSIAVKTKRVQMKDGDMAEIPAFWEEYFSSGHANTIAPAIGACGDMSKESKEFSYGIGNFINGGQAPAGFELWQAPKGSWAVFKCIGSMPAAIQEMWGKIHTQWMPTAEYELVENTFDFELYTQGDTSAADYVSEIWLPVKKKA